MSHRLGDGTRRNQWGATPSGHKERKKNGDREKRTRPSHKTFRVNDGTHARDICAIANPGNLIKTKTGGGHLGDRIAHENEAPFPESLAEFFIRSLCPPGGTVLDPFGGSGTTAKVAIVSGRNAVAIDIRSSQIDLMRRRMASDNAKVRELF